MEYVKAMGIKARMCEKYRGDFYCTDCPLTYINNGKNITCTNFIFKHPAESEAILTKWDDENPVKTMMSDFFEKFPNAPKRKHTEPYACPCDCGYVLTPHEKCKYANGDCFKCWSRPL